MSVSVYEINVSSSACETEGKHYKYLFSTAATAVAVERERERERGRSTTIESSLYISPSSSFFFSLSLFQKLQQNVSFQGDQDEHAKGEEIH